MKMIHYNGAEFYPIYGASCYYVSRCGAVYSTYENECLPPQDNGSGYKQVWLKRDDGATKWHKIHRLVAIQFLPNPENKPDVNHIDGNKANNAVHNLEWCTKSENTRHAYATGLMKAKKGEEHHLFGKQASPETKAKMAAAKQGENHPKFRGYYKTPYGLFTSANAAAVHFGMVSKTVDRWCKSGNKVNAGWDFLPISGPSWLPEAVGE